MSIRTGVTSISTISGVPRTSTPRNGHTVSKTRRLHSGLRARWRSLTSPSAMTISNAPSCQRNQTGVGCALSSRRYVVSTAGAGASRSVRAPSGQAITDWKRQESSAVGDLERDHEAAPQLPQEEVRRVALHEQLVLSIRERGRVDTHALLQPAWLVMQHEARGAVMEVRVDAHEAAFDRFDRGALLDAGESLQGRAPDARDGHEGPVAPRELRVVGGQPAPAAVDVSLGRASDRPVPAARLIALVPRRDTLARADARHPPRRGEVPAADGSRPIRGLSGDPPLPSPGWEQARIDGHRHIERAAVRLAERLRLHLEPLGLLTLRRRIHTDTPQHPALLVVHLHDHVERRDLRDDLLEREARLGVHMLRIAAARELVVRPPRLRAEVDTRLRIAPAVLGLRSRRQQQRGDDRKK